ncbi:MAG: hypothetical protein K0R65_1792 [Crocinitomicaceae bacterium]|jgi:PKD repeat protein|nr:hypothetical protein [Crocinitomicaceae bacterium]
MKTLITFIVLFAINFSYFAQVDIQVEAGQLCAGRVIEFNCLGVGNAINVAWDFGDTTVARDNDKVTGHKYESPGTYYVKGVVYDRFNVYLGEDTDTITISGASISLVSGSNEAVTDIFYDDPTLNVKSGDEVDFAAHGSFNSVSWSLGLGQSSTQSQLSLVYAERGYFTIIATFSTDECGTMERTARLYVSDPGLEHDPAQICDTGTVRFMYTGADPDVSYVSWSFFPADSLLASFEADNVLTEYSYSGQFPVQVGLFNSLQFTIGGHVIYIDVPDNNVHVNESIELVNSAVHFHTFANLNSITWDFGDGFISHTANAEHFYTNPGNYEAIVTMDVKGCGIIQQTLNVSILDITVNGPASACPYDPLTFTINNATPGEFYYSWNLIAGQDTVRSQDTTITVAFGNAGQYYRNLFVYDENDNLLIIIPVNFTIHGGNAQANNTVINRGSSVNFSLSGNNNDVTQWNFDDGGTSAATSPGHTFNQYGPHTVVVSYENTDCGILTDTIMIHVQNFDVGFEAPVICANDSNLFFFDGYQQNQRYFRWDFGDGTIIFSDSAEMPHAYASAGIYTVSLSVYNADTTLLGSESRSIDVRSISISLSTLSNYDNGQPYISNVGDIVLFDIEGGSGADVVWNFGDENGTTVFEPYHIYTEPGSYLIQAAISDNYCGEMTLSLPIQITDFQVGFSPDSICSGEELTLDLSGNPGMESYTIHFGEGTVLNTTDPVVNFTYPANGQYTLEVRFFDTGGNFAGTYIGQMYVGKAKMEVSTQHIRRNQLVYFLSEGNIESIVWDFGDGNTSTDLNPSHAYTTSGVFTPVGTAQTPCGEVVFATDIIVTNNLGGMTVYQENQCSNVRFVANSLGTRDVLWEFGDGTYCFGRNGDITHYYENPGTYIVVMKVYLNGLVSYGVSQLVTVSNVAETPVITADGSTSFCEGGSVSLSSSVTADTYLWYPYEETGAVLVVDTSGYYFLVATVNGCESAPSNVIAVVSNGLEAPVIAADGNLNFCAGDSVTLSTSVAAESYHWYPNGETGQDLIVDSSGYFFLTISLGGCESLPSNIVNVVVTPYPETPVIVADGPLAFCEGDSVLLTSAEPALSYVWSDGSVAPQLYVQASGMYSLSVSSNGCSSPPSDTVQITVNALPEVNLPALSDICDTLEVYLFPAADPLGGTYTGEGITGSEFHPGIAGVGEHEYSYTYVDLNSCSTTVLDTLNVVECILAGNTEILTDQLISIYPNPASSVLYIRLNTDDIDKISLQDNLGREVRLIENPDVFMSVDVSAFANGIYYLRLDKNDGQLVYKIHIER